MRRIDDLDCIAALGIRTLRYPLLWEQLAPEQPERIEWQWADARLQRLRELGVEPIAGLLHHGSGPSYATLSEPEFPALFARYARAVAERYPWVTAYTPINEPLTTARFCGLYGHWFPQGRDPLTFLRMLLAELRATVLAMRAIREINPAATLVQTEDLGEIFSTPALGYQAEFENERRWLGFDLLCGRVNRAHPAWSYLKYAGLADEEIEIFSDEPCPPDVLGLNHYVTSDRFLDEELDKYSPECHGGNGRMRYADSEAVRWREEGKQAPAELLRQAWERYHIPLAITEAHLACTREEQMRWFFEIWNAAASAQREGIEVRAVTAWALLGSYDWDSLLTQARGFYESGAFDLRAPFPRPTALAGLLREIVANGTSAHPALSNLGWWHRQIRLHNTDRQQPAALRRIYQPGRIVENDGPGPLLLITGATGTLGQAFARMCYLRGLPYRLLSRAEMDIASDESVHAAFDAFHPWAIINAAGYVRVDDAENESWRCFRENCDGPAILAEACMEHGAKLVTFSSDLVFDGTKTGAYVESDPVAPLSVYGLSKAAAEARVAAMNANALIVRTSAFFGPWDQFNFAATTLAALQNGEPVQAADDVFVSPTYVPDLVRATLDLLIDDERGIWHLANAGRLSWFRFAQKIAQHAAGDLSLVEQARDVIAPAARPKNSALQSERAQLMPSLDDALARCFAEIASCEPAAPAHAG